MKENSPFLYKFVFQSNANTQDFIILFDVKFVGYVCEYLLEAMIKILVYVLSFFYAYFE